jgi:predicted ribosome quality control (RQC) complex YloA/Tae2 family protein
MTCDSLMLRRMVTELEEFKGARVARAFPQGKAEFVLEFSTRRELPQVVLSSSSELGRVHRADGLEPVIGADTPLADVLRRHLKGATFLGVTQLQFDRVLRLEFGNAEGMGPQSRRSLVAEIMGRHSNLLLLDERDYILECARHVTSRVNRVRQSLPGEAYMPPPEFDKVEPETLTAERLRELLPEEPMPLAKWLRSIMQGASDVFLAVLLWRQGLGQDATTTDLEEDGGELGSSPDAGGVAPQTREPGSSPHAEEWLLRTMREMMREAEAPGAGYLAVPPGKQPLAYPLPLPPDWEPLGTLPSLSAACQMLQRQVAQAGQARQIRQRLVGVLEAAVVKAQRRENERQASIDKAQHAEEYREQGQMLLAHLNLLQPGASEVTLPAWDGGEDVTLRLDPRLSPQQNAQAYFDRYKKMQRIKDRVPALLAEARQTREYLEDLLDQAETAEPDELRLLEQEMMEQGLLKAPRRRQEVKAAFRRTETPDGYTMLYGRSGLENAAVLKAAKSEDLWFHVQGAPGGHVVIRTNNRPEAVPQSTLLEAAKLAARQSRRRRDAVVEVDYTQAKHLTRQKGAAPGHVIYREFKTLLVKPSAD